MPALPARPSIRRMNPKLGWALAALFVALSWQVYGWKGLALAVSVTVFWLLLQFNRAVRVMKNAGGAPVGHVANAVMFHSRLAAGMTMLQVVALTKSLGRKLDEAGERWAWQDEAGAHVSLEFERGKLVRFVLDRGVADVAGAPTPAP